jgi:hypothetical protein
VLGLALADRAGVRVGQRHQPIGNHAVTGQPLVGLGQQPPGRGDRLLQLTDQPTQPPVARSTGQRPAGVARHHLHLLQGVPGDLSDLAGQPVHLTHCHPGAPAQRASQLLEPPARRPTPVPEPGPAGDAASLDAAHQPTDLAHRLLQQVGVGG